MKQYLFLAALAAGICSAQESPPAIQRVAEARPAAVQATAAAKQSTTRQLTAEQKAELRRQLYQYSHSRLPSKGY